MARVFRYIFLIILGLLFGVASFLALTPALAAFFPLPEDGTVTSLLILAAVTTLVAMAPTVRRACGRGFLIVGASVFALPLSAMLLSGRAMDDMYRTAEASGTTVSDAETAGAAIGGMMMTGVAGFIGFFFGAILLMIGLILSLGGRRDVRVVD